MSNISGLRRTDQGSAAQSIIYPSARLRAVKEVQTMDAEKKDNRGKKFHQKIKPYVVLQYLLKYTDENHVESGEAIAAALDENYKLSAERRSIYRDIQEINAVALMHF